MIFLFPYILIAGLSILIPILIHLFNLRKYKEFEFPDTRWIENSLSNNKKVGTLKHKLLLGARIGLVLMLVLAFAQPIFDKNSTATQDKIQIYYLDNSYSMLSKINAHQSSFDLAKLTLINAINSGGTPTKYILTNNSFSKINSRTELSKLIQDITISSHSKNFNQLINQVNDFQIEHKNEQIEFFLLSDFYSSFFSDPLEKINTNIKINLVSVLPTSPKNQYIDTAYFDILNKESDAVSQLIVKSKQINNNKPTSIEILYNNQKLATKTIQFTDNMSVDTFNLKLNNTVSYNALKIIMNDPDLSFDDTFNIAIKNSGNLKFTMANKVAINPYVQAAISAFKNTQITNVTQEKADLTIFQDITTLTTDDKTLINTNLQEGKSILITLGNQLSIDNFNTQMKDIVPIKILGLDTVKNSLENINHNHPFLSDIFESIPPNAKLPIINTHYKIVNQVNVNASPLLVMRNNDPILTLYKVKMGNLFILSTSLADPNSNIVQAPYFAPIIYKMALLSNGEDQQAYFLGKRQAIEIKGTTKNNEVIKLKNKELEIIPEQTKNGLTTTLFVEKSAITAGFYEVENLVDNKGIKIALNNNRLESVVNVVDLDSIINSKNYKPFAISKINLDKNKAAINTQNNNAILTNWRILLIIGLLFIMLETFLLLRK